MKYIFAGLFFGLLFYGSVAFMVRHESHNPKLFVCYISGFGMGVGMLLGLAIHITTRIR